MRCSHCGTTGGTERTVRFQGERRSTLTLCDECVRDFERDETVVDVRTPATQ